MRDPGNEVGLEVVIMIDGSENAIVSWVNFRVRVLLKGVINCGLLDPTCEYMYSFITIRASHIYGNLRITHKCLIYLIYKKMLKHK